MQTLLTSVRACTLCKPHLPNYPRPVLSLDPKSKILIIGQAPGQKVHDSGIPWNDQSGDELRRWLDIGKEHFYNPKKFGIMPMGFCYPGKGKSGDLPPRPECAAHWHEALMDKLKHVDLILLIGKYSQNYYLENSSKKTLTENVMDFKKYLPKYFPLVHPSPRNRIWQKKNPWFETDVIPELRKRVKSLL